MSRRFFPLRAVILTFTPLLCALCVWAQGEAASKTAKTVWAGVYTAAQAARGQAAYSAACSSCHRDDLSGPFSEVLKGERFMNNWQEQTLFSLFNLMATTMPQLSPGSLKPATFVDIVSYVLQVNGFPAGPNELTVPVLRNVQVTGKDGPGQMPDGALVSVAGCLARSSDGTWALLHAADAFRTMNPNKPGVADLKAAESSPAGTREFHLTDTDFFQPGQHEGKKVEARGFLKNQPDGPRLYLTALNAVASACPAH